MSSEEVRRSRSRRPAADPAVTGAILRYLFGLGGSVLICGALLYVFARIMCMVDVPMGWIVPITTCCSAVAVLLGAWLLAAKTKQNGALWGALLALGCWAVLCLVGLLRGQTFSNLALLKLLTFVCAGMFGGVLGIYLQERRKRKRPRR